MRAIVDAKVFSQALNKVTKVLKQSAIPILEGVLVQKLFSIYSRANG